MGLMVWSEIPVYWDIDWQSPRDPGQRPGATARHDCARPEPRVGDHVVDVE